MSFRLAALKLLADTGIVNGDPNYILVEVFNLSKESQVCTIYHSMQDWVMVFKVLPAAVVMVSSSLSFLPQVKQLFTEINSAQPVKLIDMPGQWVMSGHGIGVISTVMILIPSV